MSPFARALRSAWYSSRAGEAETGSGGDQPDRGNNRPELIGTMGRARSSRRALESVIGAGRREAVPRRRLGRMFPHIGLIDSVMPSKNAYQRALGISKNRPRGCVKLFATVLIATQGAAWIRFHEDSPARVPEARAACHTLGAFFKSKFLFQSLPRLRTGGLVACFAVGSGFRFSAGTHCCNGK